MKIPLSHPGFALLRCFVLIALLDVAMTSNNCAHRSNPHITPIICPAIDDSFLTTNWRNNFSSYYVCPRFVSNKTHGLSLQSPFVVAEQLKWTATLNAYIQKLRENDAAVMLFGDSLTATMLMQMRCLEIFANIPESETSVTTPLKDGHAFGWSNPFLAHLPKNYTSTAVPERFANKYHNWYEGAKMVNSARKYVVLNVGAWWGHVQHRHGEGAVDLQEAYRLHFAAHSDLMIHIRSLIQDHNVTVVWRDTSPAGICGEHDKNLDHGQFSSFNYIARKALLKEGVLMLDIWNATLPYWDQHLGGRDQLHYCTCQVESAQNVWILSLIELISNHLDGH
jgi:hypothetical protein